MQHSCTVCGKAFETSRAHARYCSSTCRGRALRTRKADSASGADVVTLSATASSKRTAVASAPADEESVSLVEVVTQQLRSAGKLATYGGQQALVVAKRLQASGGDTGAAVASLSKELERLMTIIMADVQTEPDAIDEAQAAVLQLRTTRRRRG